VVGKESHRIFDDELLEDPTSVEALEDISKHLLQPQAGEPSSALVSQALKYILESPVFRPSKRGSQFLRFVVEYRLQGHREPLKERTIGAALFNRPLDYSTGDDSVVRAQAREVRRRLEKYYAAYPNEHPVHIELPVGSYTPEFRWCQSPRAEVVLSGAISIPDAPAFIDTTTSLFPAISRKGEFNRRKVWIAAVSTVICSVCLLGIWRFTQPPNVESVTTQFWAPAFATSNPLLICLPKPLFYRPTADVYKRSARFPGEFDHEIDRMTHPPHLRPDDMIRWGDMVAYYDYGVSQGDVEAAIRLSNFFGRQGKASEVRIGNGSSAADMRNSPAVVIGAFSNPIAIEMTSGLHFAFIDDDKGIRIQEQGTSGRSWSAKHGPVGEDYGLVTRLLDSGTGQFVVLLAGVEASGSDAAADLVVHPGVLEKALVGYPIEWPKKNLQIVVSATVNDSVAGPPRVVAVYSW
jgi:hypothetical protein